MKCNSCGANFQTADVKCPYCGSRNIVGEEWQEQRNWAKALYESTLRRFREEGALYAINAIMNKAIKILAIVILVCFGIFLIPSLFSEAVFELNKSLKLGEIEAQMEAYHSAGQYEQLEQVMDEYDMFGKEYYIYSQSAILYRNYQDYLIHKVSFFDMTEEEKLEDDYHIEYALRDSLDVYLLDCGIYDDLQVENSKQLETYQQEIMTFWKNVLGLTEEEIQYMIEEEYLYTEDWDRYIENIKERKAWQ